MRGACRRVWWFACWCVLCSWTVREALAEVTAACEVAEYSCKNQRCVRQDQYCDGIDHCGDNSDEPPRCTVCNRTYYGRVGVTYSLALEANARAPILCHVTLTAGGGARGELVQLLLDDFRVGRLLPRPACADGEAQLAELGRPFAGGAWCGRAAGAVYFSEASTVTLTVRARRGPPPVLRLRYRFLPRAAALVRSHDTAETAVAAPGRCALALEDCHRRPCRLRSPNFPGLYPRNASCYWNVRQRTVPSCKHAMIAVRQAASHKLRLRSVPASVNRTRGVAAWSACGAARDRLLFYDGASTDDPLLALVCGGDSLPPVVSRGPTMLVAFHSAPYATPRAAAPLSPLTGFELDVDVIFADSESLDYAREPNRCEFHVKASSSQDDTAGGEVPVRGRRGELRAPTHSLPPNTTCTWTFHGRPNDIVWIYFSSYVHYSLEEPLRGDEEDDVVAEEPPEDTAGDRPGGRLPGEQSSRVVGDERPEERQRPVSPWAQLREMLRPRTATSSAPTELPHNTTALCPTELRIWDGGGIEEPDSLLIGRWCGSPAVCARAALVSAPRSPRPCAPPDGYVSTGAMLSVATHTSRGTATHPLRFSLHYEFVDTRLPGESLPGSNDCGRLVTQPGRVWSPRDVRLFGRGGARSLRCVTRISAQPGRRVSLSLLSLALGAPPPPPATAPRPLCVTRMHPHTGLPSCVSPDSTSKTSTVDEPLEEDWEAMMLDNEVQDADLDDDARPRILQFRIWDTPWPGVRVLRACYCGEDVATTVGPTSASDEPPLGIRSWGEHLELELVADRLRTVEDHRHVNYLAEWTSDPDELPGPAHPSPPGARARLDREPHLLRARSGRSVFLRVWGDALPRGRDAALDTEAPRCDTVDRILVYSVTPPRLVKAICPHESSRRAVHMFSESWYAEGVRGPGGRINPADRALVVAGTGSYSWMEVWRPVAAANGTGGGCAHGCPELAACASAALWCDGVEDCPRGADERCGGARRLWARLGGARGAGGAALGAGAALLVGAALAVTAACRRRRRSTKTPRRLTEEMLFGSRGSSPGS